MSIDELKSQYKLQSEIFWITQREIIETFTRYIFPVNQPVAIILGGQPGSGKSELIGKAQILLKNNAVVCNADLYREFHPDYEEIITYHEGDYPEITAKVAQDWNDGLRAHCEQHQLNFIMETTFSSGERMNQTLHDIKAAGYVVYIMLMAVPAKISLLCTYLRYEDSKRTTGKGRLVERHIHDEKYARVADTLQLVQAANLFDHLLIYYRATENATQIEKRDKILLLAENPPDPLTVYLNERDKPWDSHSRSYFKNNCNNVIRMMKERNAGEDAIELFKINLK